MAPEQTDQPSDDQLADLARLADGTLPADRRAEVEAQVAASPDLSRMAASQAVAMEALRDAGVRTGAPARLRAEVDRRRDPGRAAPSGRRRFAVGGALAAGIAVALALVLVLPGALSGGPSVADAAALAQKPPSAPAPAGVPGTPQLLAAEVGDVPFPNYAAKFGWEPTGVRRDELSGRNATTVFYEKGGRTIGYTIVSGEALDPPSDARSTTRGGVEYHLFRADDGRAAVTWERGGHTCVLSSATAPSTELLGLADWRGKGAIPF